MKFGKYCIDLVFLFIFIIISSLFQICKAQTISLKQLKDSINSNPIINIAKENYEIAKTQIELDKIALYPTLFGSVTYNNYSNPVYSSIYKVFTKSQSGTTNSYRETITPVQERYNEITTNIGLNIPLFGSRQALKQNLISNESLEKQSLAELKLKKWQLSKSLVYTYSEYFIRSLQVNLADEFLKDEEQVKNILLERQKAGLILKSDRLELDTEFSIVKRNKFIYSTKFQDSLNALRLITGKKLDNFQPVYPALDTDFVTYQFIIDSVYRNPQIKLYVEKLNGYKKILEEKEPIFSSGNLSISSGVQTVFQGSAGWNVMIGLTVNMPLFNKKWRQAIHSKALLNVQKAQLELDNQIRSYKEAADKYYMWLQSRYENLRTAKERVNAAFANYETTRLRTLTDPGDYFYRLIKSKYYLYQTINNYLEALLDLFKAKANILGLIGFSKKVYNYDRCDRDNARFISKIFNIFASTSANKSLNNKYINWYAWNGLYLYKKLGYNFWDEIPQSTKSIFLSLDNQEINLVSSVQNEASILIRFMRQARQRNISVRLLLGEPTWVLDKYRKNLITIIRKLEKFNFDGIELDMERSQLPEEYKHLWDEGIIKTITAVRSITSLPIGLSLNYREAENHNLLERLKAVGLNHINLMIYTVNTDKIIKIADKVIEENPELNFSIALSCEPIGILEKDESFAKYGFRNSLLLKWSSLYSHFKTKSNFSGITIQSLKDFLRLKGEN